MLTVENVSDRYVRVMMADRTEWDVSGKYIAEICARKIVAEQVKANPGLVSNYNHLVQQEGNKIFFDDKLLTACAESLPWSVVKSQARMIKPATQQDYETDWVLGDKRILEY